MTVARLRPLANATYHQPRTLNLYKTLIPNPSERGKLLALGWEEPAIRIANTVSWLLHNARAQGLPVTDDGYVRVQDLLHHPRMGNVDFPTLERMVLRFRSHSLVLNHEPRVIPHHVSGSQLDCWWIGLHGVVKPSVTDQRLTRPERIPALIHETCSTAWPRIHKYGISRGKSDHIAFTTKKTIPLQYSGDRTFIYLDASKAIGHLHLPFYNCTSTINRPGTRNSCIPHQVKTPIPNISPSMFQSAIRVIAHQFPLLSRSRERTKGVGKLIVHTAGVDALKKHGYDGVVKNSMWDLGQQPVSKQPEQRKSSKRRHKTASSKMVRNSARDLPPHQAAEDCIS